MRYSKLERSNYNYTKNLLKYQADKKEAIEHRLRGNYTRVTRHFKMKLIASDDFKNLRLTNNKNKTFRISKGTLCKVSHRRRK